MHTYKVRVSPNMVIRVRAKNAREAKKLAWMEIKNSYTYGYTSKSDFMSGATAEREV